tara:strand:- start:89 stop:499 length:411 start_codon:yes stop_codon:yes gene_type:complete
MVYVEVVSGLWFGNVDMMYKPQFLSDNQIEVIINCTYQFHFPEGNTQNIRIPLPETIYQSLDLIRHNKERIIQLISDKLESHNILIVCYDGKTLSPFLVCLYLMSQGGITKEQAKQTIQSKHTEIPMDFDVTLLDL